MQLSEILKKCDHTLLSQTATKEDILRLCDEGMKFHTASVCIPPCYVKPAKDYVGERLRICTVVGFPNGYSTSAIKVLETEQAIRDGADEIDMVINIGALKAGAKDEVLREIAAVRQASRGVILKVIIETAFLTREEKIEMCKMVSESGADFIKTSTGFASAGATREDIALFKEHIAPHLKIKAAGGISSIADAQDFIRLGAQRLGTSKIVKLAMAGEDAPLSGGY